MNLSNISKSLIYISSTLGLLTIGNLVSIAPAGAFRVTFSNGGFDDPTPNDPLNGWFSTTDATINTGIDGVSPLSNPNQAIITTGYRNTNNRIDDRNNLGNLDFNQSGNKDPIDADPLSTNNLPSGDLQSFLNLGQNDFSLARSNNLGGYRLPKEGSAMYQDIIVEISQTDVDNGTNGFNLNFNWAYLSNDGKSPDFGNQDFSFVSIANDPNPAAGVNKTDSNFADGIVKLLGDSDQSIRDGDGNIIDPSASNDFIHSDTTYYDPNNIYTESVTGLEAGTYGYRIGFGAVDVDSYDRTSALLVDNFSVEQVPFEFSPTIGLLFIGGVFGFKTAWEKRKSEVKS